MPKRKGFLQGFINILANPIRAWSDMFTLGAAELLWQNRDTKDEIQAAIDKYDPNAEGANPYDLLKEVTESSVGIGGTTAEQEKYIDDLIAQYEAKRAEGVQKDLRDTSLLSSAEQLEALGLSPSGVLQTGGASSGASSFPAQNVKENISQQKYNQQSANTRAMIGMIRGMASSGIYGSAYSKARSAVARLAPETAKSAIEANAEAEQMSQIAHLSKDELLKQLNTSNPSDETDMSKYLLL